jgi:hypothetical protein
MAIFLAVLMGTGLRLSFGTLVGLPSLMMKVLSWLRCSNRTIDAASCLNASSKAAKPFKSGYYRIKGINKMSATMRRALKTADDIELHEARMSLGQARNTMCSE